MDNEILKKKIKELTIQWHKSVSIKRARWFFHSRLREKKCNISQLPTIMINEAERSFRFQNKWDLLGEENISKGFDSNHVLGFLKSQKFTELLRKYTKVNIG